MKTQLLILISIIIFGCTTSTKKKTTTQEPVEKTFKSVFKDKFYVGAAMDTAQITGSDTKSRAIIESQFNTITAENYMKAENIHPEKDRYDFEMADKFVDYGLKHNMKIIGHALVWHSQLSPWFFIDNNGKQIDKEELKQRMKAHITTIVSRYKGKVAGWDVVNEAINNDGSFRESKFYQILGKDYIKMAFRFAHEADPDAELYYNDYSMNKAPKREAVVKMIKDFQAEDIRITGVGMQAHYLLPEKDPSISEIEASIKAFSSTGIKVMFTELDISVLPLPQKLDGADIALKAKYEKGLNPYTNGLPRKIRTQFDKRYLSLFKLFVKYADVIDRVTFWGVTDNQSWKNNWPVKGRTDYPLLFDRNYKAKDVVTKILNTPKSSKEDF